MRIIIKKCMETEEDLHIDAEDTVENIKYRIEEQEGFPFEKQKLVFDGRELRDNDTAFGLGIQEESRVHVVMSLIDLREALQSV
mmetsp:Transcript_3791/g.3176  ORF Transcript_3791/g.3176 Transcript_3791/m.3176 type:complete len:84 (+) Transcript_3791:58-309(+)